MKSTLSIITLLFIVCFLNGCSYIFVLRFSPGTHGNIMQYDLEYSKSEVNNAIQKFLDKNKQYIVSQEIKESIKHYEFGNTDENNLWNSDSVNFHFIIKYPSPQIIWIKFSGLNKDWDEPTCTISLIAISELKNDKILFWKKEKHLNRSEKRKLTTRFEKEVLNPILVILLNSHNP